LKQTKKTLITTETSETLIVRQATRQRAWCEVCGAEVEMVSPELAARSAGVGVRAVFRLIETERVHFMESPDGALLVCLNTLKQIEEMEDEENV
jgi:hypothetical protein